MRACTGCSSRMPDRRSPNAPRRDRTRPERTSILRVVTPGAGDREADMAGEPFGRTWDGRAVTRYTLARGPLRAEVIDYGGILTRLDVPDRAGRAANVVLGFPDFADYEARNP